MTNNQASEPRWSRLLKKRELLSYYILCRDPRKWNIGEAVDHLIRVFNMSRKVAFNIVRRLIRLKLLVKVDNLTYTCIPFEQYIEELVKNYAEKRARRRSS